ncbi:MAG: alpha/beta hydrolase [Burkholderiales bacterium]
MRMSLTAALAGAVLAVAGTALAQEAPRVVDVPTRGGVTQRLLVITPPQPKAVVVLFAGGHGGLQLAPDGRIGWGGGNFLVRARDLFAQQGYMTVVIDASSDRQREPFLSGYRQTAEHVADVKAVIAWSRQQAKLPVWLIGTSRGTQSVAYVATQLQGADAPDGIVLTSSIVDDPRGRAVPRMDLELIRIPTLVVHHEEDGCRLCLFRDVPRLMSGLSTAPRKELIAFRGGVDIGDPCEARAYHGYNGLEPQVVSAIAAWMAAK